MLDPHAPLLQRIVDASRAQDEAPAAMAAYLKKVALYAYKVTDEDIAAMRAAGHSEDQIFEATVRSAVEAGRGRVEAALRALRGGG